MSSFIHPRISKTKSFIQTTYDLPHRIHCSKYYPLALHPTRGEKSTTAPNILVYGHEQGISVVWSGFKAQLQKKRKRSAVSYDSEDDEVETRTSNPRAPSRRRRRLDNGSDVDGDNYMEITDSPRVNFSTQTPALQASLSAGSRQETHQIRTIHLGTAVYDISFVPSSLLPPVSLASIYDQFASEGEDDEDTPLSSLLLKRNIILSAACADHSVRLIAVSLDPSTHSSPQIVTLAGLSGHRTSPTTISLTIVPSLTPRRSRPEPTNRSRPATAVPNPPSTAPSFDFLIASSSPDISGLLLLWRISPEQTTSAITLVRPRGPRTIALSFPATHARFNPSSTSSLSRHNLLIADTSGALRIYDTDKAQWLISFYTDYPTHGHFQSRKRILGIDWCLDGKAIVALTDDGEYGIWELLERGKYTSCGKVGESLDGSNHSSRRFPGAGFSTRHGESTASSSTTGAGGGGGRGGNSIYSNSTITSTRQLSPTRHNRAGDITKGSLTLTTLPSSSNPTLFSGITPKNSPADHEMLALVFENQLLLIPSLQETLAAKKKALVSIGGGIGVTDKTRLIELKDIVLGGEDIHSLGMGWFVARRESPPPSTPKPLPLQSQLSSPPPSSPQSGHSNSPERNLRKTDSVAAASDEKIPHIKLTLATGPRVQVLAINDDVLSTEIAPPPTQSTTRSSNGNVKDPVFLMGEQGQRGGYGFNFDRGERRAGVVFRGSSYSNSESLVPMGMPVMRGGASTGAGESSSLGGLLATAKREKRKAV